MTLSLNFGHKIHLNVGTSYKLVLLLSRIPESSLTTPIYSYVVLGEESGNLMSIATKESLL